MSILHISPVTRNTWELITHAPLADRVSATLTLVGMKHLKRFNPKLPTKITDTSAETHKTALTACYHRWARALRTTKSPTVKDFYHALCTSLHSENRSLPSLEDLQRNNTSPNPPHSRTASQITKATDAVRTQRSQVPEEPSTETRTHKEQTGDNPGEMKVDPVIHEDRNSKTNDEKDHTQHPQGRTDNNADDTTSEDNCNTDAHDNDKPDHITAIETKRQPSWPESPAATPPPTPRVLRNKRLPRSSSTSPTATRGRLERKRLRLLQPESIQLSHMSCPTNGG